MSKAMEIFGYASGLPPAAVTADCTRGIGAAA
jgi:hypothetical protein